MEEVFCRACTRHQANNGDKNASHEIIPRAKKNERVLEKAVCQIKNPPDPTITWYEIPGTTAVVGTNQVAGQALKNQDNRYRFIPEI